MRTTLAIDDELLELLRAGLDQCEGSSAAKAHVVKALKAMARCVGVSCMLLGLPLSGQQETTINPFQMRTGFVQIQTSEGIGGLGSVVCQS